MRAALKYHQNIYALRVGQFEQLSLKSSCFIQKRQNCSDAFDSIENQRQAIRREDKRASAAVMMSIG